MSNAEYLVYSACMNTLNKQGTQHVEFYGVCIVDSLNGTRCRDGVKVLWCHCHLVWLVFYGSIPTCACFHSENFFGTCSCCFLLLFFLYYCLGIVREKRREGRLRGRCMAYKV